MGKVTWYYGRPQEYPPSGAWDCQHNDFSFLRDANGILKTLLSVVFKQVSLGDLCLFSKISCTSAKSWTNVICKFSIGSTPWFKNYACFKNHVYKLHF